MARKQTKALHGEAGRTRRPGFRLDRKTKNLSEHAAVTLSARDRQAFFAVLINPPKPSERLVRAWAEHKRRIEL